MFKRRLSAALAALLVSVSACAASFTLEQVLSAPFASDIVAAPSERAFAWVSNASGRRNIWLAAGQPRLTGRQLTHYGNDDGLEISDIAFVPHRAELLYVLGGDIEYPDKPAPNPGHLAAGVEQEVYVIGFRGGAPRKLGAGHAPVSSPSGDVVLFLQQGVVFSVAMTKNAKPTPLFKIRGAADSLRFSPDGRQLAFVSNRADHSFVGIYKFADKSVRPSRIGLWGGSYGGYMTALGLSRNSDLSIAHQFRGPLALAGAFDPR